MMNKPLTCYFEALVIINEPVNYFEVFANA